MYEAYQNYCTELHRTGRYRKLPDVNLGLELLDFSTNDYLGMSQSKGVLEAAKAAGDQFGVGATGSRLLSGNKKIFEDLEHLIAKDKGTESALILNSGFQANVTVLSSLLDASVLGERPLVFFDKYNHASLYQGVFLSRAELVRYAHNDMQHLSHLLHQHKQDPRPKFIVTETVFGMDGDCVALQEIVSLARQHHAFLYLDDSHGTGVMGQSGYGVSTDVDLAGTPHVIMGTLSKALGGFGAYIACAVALKNYIINKSPGFIYATALPPMVIGAAQKAWDTVRHLGDQRQELMQKAEYLRSELKSMGLNTGASNTHIIPIILEKEDIVMEARDRLLRQGVVVSAVRPPTVPSHTARLRIALTVHHTYEEISYLVSCVRSFL